MSYAGPKLRQGIRLTSRRCQSNSLLVRPCCYSARPLSTVLSTSHRSLLQVSFASRSFSLWPSSKTSTTPIPPSSPPHPVAEKSNEPEMVSGTSPVETTSNTTPTTDNSAISDPLITPEPASILDSSTITDVLHNIPVPLQYGDFAALGLTGWSPSGIIRWTFEIINVASGLPWFWTIVAGSAFWRFICVPLTIKASRAAAILQPHQEQLAALQERVRQMSTTQNPAALAKAHREMKDFYGKLGVSPFGGLIGLLQLPVTLGMFFAVKKMCDLPVEQLKYSGFEMFPDLTIADPTLILPIAMTVAINAQLLVGARDVGEKMRPMMYMFHFLTVPGFFLLKSLPVGLILSMLTTGILTTTQTFLMRIPHVRRALRMPAYAPPKGGGKSFFEELRPLFVKDGDIKEKVAQARREATRKKSMQQPSQRL